MDTFYVNAAVANGTAAELILDESIHVQDNRIQWMGHDDEAPEPGPATRIVDAGGTTVVPGMVDAHSHTVLPGGSH